MKSIGDVVWEHAKQSIGGTDDGIAMLGLRHVDDAGARNGAANLYLAALSIISDQRTLNAELLAALKILRADHSRMEPHHEDLCEICAQADAVIAKAAHR